MAQNLVLDVKLNQDSYTSNNTNGLAAGTGGMVRFTVAEYRLPTGSNFAAQLYQAPDGTYKIAYRGTVDPTAVGDAAMNAGIVAGRWTAEMGESVKFTLAAIQQVATDKGIPFAEAKTLFTLTGHSQGGFEAELNAKFFGIGGTSIDGPGASPLVGTSGWNALKDFARAQEPGVQQTYDIGAFLARRYTVLVGGLNQHVAGAGMKVDSATASLFLQFASLFTTPLGAAVSLGFQAYLLHDLNNILKLEELRQQVPWLQKLVDVNDPNGNPGQIAADIAGEWAQVQVAGAGAIVSANDVQAIIDGFLVDRSGQTIAVQELDRTVRIQSSNGDVLTLFPDGSGLKVVGAGLATVQTEYAKGGRVLASSSLQVDDDGNLLVSRNGPGFSSIVALDATGVPINASLKTFNAQSQLQAETFITRNADGTSTALTYNSVRILLSTAVVQTNDDGSTLATTTYPNGKVEILATDSNNQRSSLNVTTPTEGGGQFVENYTYINGIKTHQSSTSIDYDYSEAGITRTELVTTASGSVRNVYNESDSLLSSEALPSAGPSNLELSNAANVATDLLNFSKTLASNAPGLYKFGSGIVLLNNHLNPGGPTASFPNFGTAATVAQGALGLYNLGQAFSASGNELGQFSAVANGLDFLNKNFIGNASLAGALNGTAGTVFNTARDGLVSSGQFGIVGGTVGVLPAIGLITSIKSGDPLGIAQSAIALFNPALLFTSGVGFTPLGWFLIGASILQTMFAPGPPKAWGVANVTYGEGIDNLGLQVNATGDSFGTERAQAGLQNIVDYLQSEVIDSYNASHDASAQVGLIAQRLPGLAWRASDAGDPGFKLTDIDPLSGEQKFPYRRFDDNGLPYSSNAAAYQVDPSDPNQRGGMGQALVMSAYNRQAIAPLWEVHTAKMQGDAGAVNAGLSEEERAAKAGLSAALDSAYAAAHPNDASANNKRLGSFMAVAMDLNGDNTITTSTIAQNAVANAASGLNNGQGMSFNWDDQSYQKKTGWIGDGSQNTDGFLVLDRDFNQSVDNGTELFSNPLVADATKGLRSLATWDADGDGRITAADPIYHQLKVWQDFDQDGNNTHGLTITDATGSHTVIVQDETSFNGTSVKELRTLAQMGIVAIDYANGRYEVASASSPNGVDYRQISTIKLEAEPEGVRYTPVGAGIQIDTSDGPPQIVITQVQSEAAVFVPLALATAGEAIGTEDAPLYEDGVYEAYNPNTQGGAITLTLTQEQLLANDTWHGLAGSNAGLQIGALGNGSHVTNLNLQPNGLVTFALEANYSGLAGFDYTVVAPDGTSAVAHVGLNVTQVGDNATVTVAKDAERPIYGYERVAYSYKAIEGESDGIHEVTKTGVALGKPIRDPYVEVLPGEPIFGWVEVGDGFKYAQVGVGPEQHVPRLTPVATDSPNTGHIAANNPDTAAFTYKILEQSTAGQATVNADGSWSYLGLRPQGAGLGDVNGDGILDYGNPISGQVVSAYSATNEYSNDYGPAEGHFVDPFVVRVTSAPGVYQDVQVDAIHYGPRPVTSVASSGGKKPIAVDLNGDGFHFQNIDDSNVFFDVNGDGWNRKIAWTSPQDGLLAFDKNGDGKINSYDEISFVPYAKDQPTDLSALKAAFDTNGDGVFSALDDKWRSFGVWQDADSDGITDAGEFKSLEALGISAIGLASNGQFQVIDGQTVHGTATATRTDGSTLAIADVTLRVKNQTQVTTTHPDGSVTTTVVDIPRNGLGQTFNGTAGKDLVFGTDGNDHFATGDGDDVIMDDKGDDLVEAGAGSDLVYTGQGNDVVSAGDGDDIVFAGAGNDLVFGDETGAGGDDILMLEDGNDVAFGGAGKDFISGGLGNDVLSGNLGDDKLFGEDGWDALFGQEGDDELYGMQGNDLLDAGDGNDLLDGGAGLDVMQGGAGDDTYVVDNAGDLVDESIDGGINGLQGHGDAGGNDAVHASISYTLGSLVENLTLTGTENLNGTGNALNNVLAGNDGNNTLAAGAGSDVLDGGLGADTLIGGSGDDTYLVDNGGDVVVEAQAEGTDTVRSRVSYILAANLENLSLVGINAINGSGNELNNTLTGNTAANVLDGGVGADLLKGNRGDDTYLVDNAADVVLESVDEGTDNVLAGISYSLSSNVENLSLTGTADINALGNMQDNVLAGNSANNLLDGGLGADAMAGGAGDDTYVVENAGDLVTEWFNAGVDTVLAGINYVLPSHVENLLLIGNAASGSGNALDNRITGNALDNVLDGDAGADTLTGGAGDDLYVVDNALDAVVELAGEGIDSVLASVTIALAANVENLTLTGSDAINATGNVLDNLIHGNSASNTLDGGAGSDTMAGGGGDDNYRVDNIGDTVVELAGGGVDTVTASVSYALSAEVENLSLTGDARSATGNDLNNLLNGNLENNLLDGGAGADRMLGGAGDDVYVVDNVQDVVVETQADGIDTVLSSVTLTVAANVENLTLTGSGTINATGDNLDNILTGNTANNVLTGGAGNDTYVYNINGGLDTVTENSGSDTVRFGAGLTLDNVALRVVTVNGQKVAQIRVLDTLGNEIATQGLDITLGVDAQGHLSCPVESFVFAGGANYGWSDLLIQSTSLIGTNKADLLLGGRNDDYIFGGNDKDVLYGGSGNDTLVGDNQEDLLYGGGGNDLLYGGNSDDALYGEAGNDLLDGANGNDLLVDLLGDNRFFAGNGNDYVLAGAGLDTIDTDTGRDIVQSGAGADKIVTGNDNDLVEAGAGNDSISSGNGADWIAAGKGNDAIDAGLDRNIFAFNRGDGADTVTNSWSNNDTLSLGAGIRYADLKLVKSGKDLILNLGEGDSVSLKDWYLDAKNHGVNRLQVITVGGDYNASSADITRNKQVELFDFAKLVQKFDAAVAANATQANGWNAMNSLLDAHLLGSNTQALGGDLSFQYGTAGALSGMGMLAAQASLAAGTGQQTLKTRSQLEAETQRLA